MIAVFTLIVLLFYPMPGASAHPAPEMATASVIAVAADHGPEGYAHDDVDASAQDCCALHCMPMGQSSFHAIRPVRFAACLAADPAENICAFQAKRLLKPPRQNLS
ncbi:hypothetical protein JYP46_04195 [Nitratireductor aquimarinus]|uniref:hypothetical protein n=1 Tax=Alphaproteobacteria TaxID=28211 RepID=UPI0019D36388|nr:MULTISPECIES: hypothetical protein [Alphaproteobacteria]MBY6020800.1 hypothetical protein [Nitratireductor sp. DP7N14-4]MBN7756014.1 hypothetical protein [Nitratireductor aquimarinus]MBN7778636.1 hypothetical protein [Nitratireductor pacificus]MBN7782959.1 hypothetical protein [Nitratireductor pacificus]MBN7791765.1 hypothetical protein [Nitratireductor aquimarinus]